MIAVEPISELDVLGSQSSNGMLLVNPRQSTMYERMAEKTRAYPEWKRLLGPQCFLEQERWK